MLTLISYQTLNTTQNSFVDEKKRYGSDRSWYYQIRTIKLRWKRYSLFKTGKLKYVRTDGQGFIAKNFKKHRESN